jgi:hypothetical protein
MELGNALLAQGAHRGGIRPTGELVRVALVVQSGWSVNGIHILACLQGGDAATPRRGGEGRRWVGMPHH